MEIKHFLELIWSLAITRLKLRNEGSFLGFLWYLLNPLLLFTLLFFIFSKRIGQDIPNYALYLLLGIIMWNFFSRTTTEALKSTKNPIIKSINFPIEALVISNIFASMLSHIFEIIVFGLFLLWFKVSPIGLLSYLPLLVFFVFFILGVSFFLSSINLYFSDLENIWSFLVRLGFFATPIFYSINMQSSLFAFSLFNPLYYFITAARQLIIYSEIPQTLIMVGIVIYTVLFFIIGYSFFNRFKKKFAELI